MTKPVLIRIDVDSVEGMNNGIPYYLEVFEKYGFSASFFIPFGTNNIVSAGLRRMWQPAFWRQFWYMKPWRTYRFFDRRFAGSVEIGLGHPNIVRDIREAGFEVALHGYDHAYISDNAYTMGEKDYSRQMDLAVKAYEDTLGEKPSGSGTPAWRFNEMIARVQDRLGLRYASDMIGQRPCRVRVGDYLSSTVQVPINIDNVFPLVVRFGGDHKKTLDYLKRQIASRGDYICMTVHTEYEFVHFHRELDELFGFMAENGMRGERFDRFAQNLDVESLPVEDVVLLAYDGAVGKVASTHRFESLIG